MDEEINEEAAIATLLKRDKRFCRETYNFINEVLDCALQLGAGEIKQTETPFGDVDEESADAHVSGADVCGAAVVYAVALYGGMARVVLESLGLRTTGDIGDAVYNMIDVGLMAKTPDDSRDDFDDLFDLGEQLDNAFEFHYEKRRR